MECRICGSEVIQNADKQVCSKCNFSPTPGSADISLSISVQDLKSKLDHGEKILLVDVRQQDEHDYAKITGSFLLPLHELPEKFDSLSRESPIVVYCHHGVRELNAARFLSQKGFKNVRNLEGGIHNWSCLIDSKVPTY